MSARLYLDHAATTPILPAARDAMIEGFARWANPSSPHAEGRAAKAELERARARIKAALGWKHELIFTSGASEAIAIALRGRGLYETVVSVVEHDAVLRLDPGQSPLPVAPDGRVEAAHRTRLASMLDPREATEFFAIQSANSETGVLQPIAAINALRSESWIGRPTFLFCDCAQTAGKLPLPEADLISVSAHKLGGPIGIGALLVRDLALLDPAGGQEQGYRPGTENLPAALGFAAALEAPRDWFDAMAPLRARLDAAIVEVGGIVVAADAPRIPTIGAYRMPGVSARAQLIQFDLAGIAISAGSACSSGSMRPSHVLTAMGWPEAEAGEVIRVSFGWTTTESDIDHFARRWKALNQAMGKRAA